MLYNPLLLLLYYWFLLITASFCIQLTPTTNAEALRLRHHVEVEVESRIVGGVASQPDRYPTIVLLSDKDKNNACAGSLILPNVVLSAAHCADNVYIAQIGVENRLEAFKSPDVETHEIEEKLVHPKYGVRTGTDCDYLLLKLSGSSKVTPIALNDDPHLPLVGDLVTAVGWGAYKEGGYMSKTLNQVTINVLSQKDCYGVYGVTLTGNMMCASAAKKDACQGDSGGPLFALGPTSATDTLVGLVSWGVGCAEAKYPGVYARISSPDALDWLKQNACQLSGIKPCNLKFSSSSKHESATGLTTSTVSKGITSASVLNSKICRDASSFVGASGVVRSCDWVADPHKLTRTRRCQQYKDKCPYACKDLYPSKKLC